MDKTARSIFITILTAILLTSACIQSFAAQYMPREVKSINNRAIGVFFAPEEIRIYAAPDEKSEMVEIIKWNTLGVKAIPQELSSFETFLAFVPEKKYALLPVLSENDNEDWVEVIYNKKTGDKGWIKNSDSEKFKTWREFMQMYGKQNRLYFLSDIPENYKSIHTGPSDEDQQISDNNIIAAQELELTYISGNWMLVRIIDYNKSTHIGWIHWRDNDGNMFVFPKLDN